MPNTSKEIVLDEKVPKEDRTAAHIEKAIIGEDIVIDAALDRRLTRKFDTHVVPWLFGLWLLAFIDRSNIGNARIDGLADDLHLDANKFNIALAVFYVPYICVDVSSSIVFCQRGVNHLRFQATLFSNTSRQATTSLSL
jgi:hypothetical protein